MWKTKDFNEVRLHLYRLRGVIPNGTLFELTDAGLANVARLENGCAASTQVWRSGQGREAAVR